jgi:HD-like signal output (HDOD) protein
MQTVSSNIDLEQIIKMKLPPLPGSVMRISSLLQDINVSQHKITEAISYDPMLATRILRLANSPVYAFQQNVTSLNMAVTALGNKPIYEMLLMGMVADSFGHEIRNSAIGRNIWLHALAVGFAARELCTILQMRGTEEAFSCGLLHDIGSLLLYKANTPLYIELFNQSETDDLSPLEKAAFGFNHAEVGAVAANYWNLSDPVCMTILHHHHPSESSQAIFLTRIISVADTLSYLKNQKLPLDQDFLDSLPVASLGFKAEQLEKVWEKVVENLREVVKAFFR